MAVFEVRPARVVTTTGAGMSASAIETSSLTSASSRFNGLACSGGGFSTSGPSPTAAIPCNCSYALRAVTPFVALFDADGEARLLGMSIVVECIECVAEFCRPRPVPGRCITSF